MGIDYNEWGDRIAEVARVVEGLGARITSNLRRPAATPDEVETLEKELGTRLPSSFRGALLGFAGSFDWSWELSADRLPPTVPLPRANLDLDQLRSGGLYWSLKFMPDMMEFKRECYESLDPDCGWPEDRQLWISTVPFMMNNIDGRPEFIGCRVGDPHDGEIVCLDYLGEWDGDMAFLAPDFNEFVLRSAQLLFADVQSAFYRLLLPNVGAGLDPDCENAVRWRRWLGLPK